MTKEEIYIILENYSQNDWKLLTKCHDNPVKFSATYNRFKHVIDYIKETYQNISFPEAAYLCKNHMDSIPSCMTCGNNLTFSPSRYTYGKFCNHKCRSAFKNNSVEELLIDGVIYSDFKQAMEKYSLSREIIRNRIFSNEYPEWKFSKNHDQVCLEKIKEIDERLLDRKFIVDWKSSGKSISGLAEYLGKHRSTIKCALLYHGIETEHSQISENAEMLKKDKNLLEELYKTKTTDEIAKDYDLTPKTIQNWLRLHDIEIDYSRSQSAIEREFIDWLSNEYPDVKISIRDSSIIGLELDIYLPEYKIAVEFDGLYWHSELPTKANKNKQSVKQKLCFKNGIRLLTFIDISETSVDYKKDIIKSIIASKINKTKRIYARKCKLVEVSHVIAANFFIENHISGNRSASRYIGLEYEGEIVMIMSFGKPFANKNYDWEIVRMASKKFTTIIGGASKIFKHFLDTSSGSIMSYANLRYGSGNVYSQIGFEYVHNTGPGYVYTDMKNVFSRNKFQKSGIQKMCPEYDSSKTEYENAEINGYKVYWDCGHLMFQYIR